MPPEVAINEAVVLAKRYASEDAARLVNGILGRIAREESRMRTVDDALGAPEELLERLSERRRSSSGSPRPTTSTASRGRRHRGARRAARRSRPS